MSAYVFENMIGRTIVEIDGAQPESESVTMTADNGDTFCFEYQPDCCATCDIESVSGDIEDLIGSPIVQAEVVSNHDSVSDTTRHVYDSFTWSFYKFATAKGSVTVRWLGQSNGYYSERVTYIETIKGKTNYVYPWHQENEK